MYMYAPRQDNVSMYMYMYMYMHVYTGYLIFYVVLRSGVQTFRREGDRFWVMAAHPSFNVFAAGKLESPFNYSVYVYLGN